MKTSAPLGVMADIAARLRDITPANFTSPREPVGKGDHPVAAANDEIKRLFTLRNLLQDEGREILALLKETAAAGEDYINNAKAAGTLDLTKEEATPDSVLSKLNEQAGQLGAQLRDIVNLSKLIDAIMWREIKHQHPDLANNPSVGIRSDWSLVWTESGKCNCPACRGEAPAGLVVVSLGL